MMQRILNGRKARDAKTLYFYTVQNLDDPNLYDTGAVIYAPRGVLVAPITLAIGEPYSAAFNPNVRADRIKDVQRFVKSASGDHLPFVDTYSPVRVAAR